MPENDQCSVEGCARTAIAALDVRSFCREHFIFTCDAQLEAYRQRLREHRLGEVSPESAWRFIQDCMREANRLELSEKNLDDLQRARLLNIILSAADLGRHVRRGPRRALSILVRSTGWDEKYFLSTLSIPITIILKRLVASVFQESRGYFKTPQNAFWRTCQRVSARTRERRLRIVNCGDFCGDLLYILAHLATS